MIGKINRNKISNLEIFKIYHCSCVIHSTVDVMYAKIYRFNYYSNDWVSWTKFAIFFHYGGHSVWFW